MRAAGSGVQVCVQFSSSSCKPSFVRVYEHERCRTESWSVKECQFTDGSNFFRRDLCWSIEVLVEGPSPASLLRVLGKGRAAGPCSILDQCGLRNKFLFECRAQKRYDNSSI